ncbi:SDR family oxidoreductase [Sorangium sp. So ce1036]|uniref:SDR family oxidoreductase n=1 Tax=Sorangium sp. So ce1036 TaxID=3133328 RepID=UPI003EFC9284
MDTRTYFQGKSLLVTGGSSGIGLAFARLVAGYGASVTLVARRRPLLDEAAVAIRREHPSARVDVLELDISRADDVARAMESFLADRPVDHLVNNAGAVMPGRFLELPIEQFRAMMDVNFFGAVHLSKAVLPAMAARRSGHVLNVSSLAGVIGIYGYTPYAASKFALIGFSQALRAEMWPHGVRVSVCMPPDTDTPQLAFENQYKPAETKAIAGNVKTLEPDAVARSMAEGMARGRFEIYPDVGSRVSAIAQGVIPGVVRWVCDSAQRKAGTAAR